MIENLGADPLMYHGRPMRWEPVNVGERNLVEMVRFDSAVHVQLEPGDGGRYNLLLTWGVLIKEEFFLDSAYARKCVLVTRFETDATINGCILYNVEKPWYTEKLGSNTWTQVFLSWWLDGLIERLNTKSKHESVEEKVVRLAEGYNA
jgi:hypothetical protein